MENLNLKELNEIVNDFRKLRNNRSVYPRVEHISLNKEDYSGSQVVAYEVYKLSDDLFVKLSIQRDSYGDNESVAGIQFVKPTTKTVTNYEPI